MLHTALRCLSPFPHFHGLFDEVDNATKDDPEYWCQPGHSRYTERLVSVLHHNHALSADMIPGQLYDKEGWIKSWSRELQGKIIAVHEIGNHPDRQRLSGHMASCYIEEWTSSREEKHAVAAVAFAILTVKFTGLDDPWRSSSLRLLARACHAIWTNSGDIGDLETAIHFYRRAEINASADSPDLVHLYSNIGMNLTSRWEFSKNSADRQEAKEYMLKAISHATNYSTLQKNLWLYSQFLSRTVSATISEIDHRQELATFLDLKIHALQTFSSDVHGGHWSDAAQAHARLFILSSNEVSSSKAIEYYKRSLVSKQGGDPDKQKWRAKLAQHYAERYHTWRRSEDRQESLRLFDRVLELDGKDCESMIRKADVLRESALRSDDVARSRSCSIAACELADHAIATLSEASESRGLDRAFIHYLAGGIYKERWDLDGDNHYLDKAVELAKVSLEGTEDDRPWAYASQCCDMYYIRYEQNKAPDDLKQAFEAVNAAIASLEQDATNDLATCSWSLGKCYSSQYERSGDLHDLGEAYNHLKAACAAKDCSKYQMALMRNDLANCHFERFRQTSSTEELDAVIQNYTQSMEDLGRSGVPANHGTFAMLQTGISQAMIERYNQWDSEDDLKSAVHASHQSLQLTDKRSPRYAGRAINFSRVLVLETVNSMHPDIALLREAQAVLKTVLELPKSRTVSELREIFFEMGHIYFEWYKARDDETALNKATQYWDQWKKVSEDGELSRTTAMISMAVLLRNKYRKSGQLQDYVDSIASFEAVRAEPCTASLVLEIRFNKAEVLFDMYIKFGDVEYGREALKELAEIAAIPNAPIHMTIRSAMSASSLESFMNYDQHSAYLQVKQAMVIWSRIVLSSSTRLEQLRMVRMYHQLPHTMTALAIDAGISPTQILSDLEQARAFMWARFLLSDAPLDVLRQLNPELASEFETCRSILTSEAAIETDSIISRVLSSKTQHRFAKLANMDVYHCLLARIRKEKGYETFPLPPNEDGPDLTETYGAPIVYLNADHFRCDALIRTPKGVQILALPDLEFDTLLDRSSQLSVARLFLDKDFVRARTLYNEIMLWLWKTIAKPVLDAVEEVCPVPEDGSKPRVYWVSGFFERLSIHAAGDWTPTGRLSHRSSVYDRVVSSYVPSLGAFDLMRKRANAKHLSTNIPQGRAVLVGMPETPGLENLEAREEIKRIEHIVKDHHPTQTLLDPPPTLTDVTSALDACELAHFACHGYADKNDPSMSGISLSDKSLNVRTLLKMKLTRCQLVFLSACETAANKDWHTSSESLHVAGAFNMVGVPHAIAGMWSIDDATSLELVAEFYKELFKAEPSSRYQGTATALHNAIGHLRSKGVEPMLWGAFVHMGP